MSTPPDQTASDQPAPTVLVVDREYPDRRALVAALETGGYRVLRAADLTQALEMFQQQRPGLVLVGELSPGLDGTETVRSIKALPGGGSVPMAVVAAVPADLQISAWLAAGADDVLDLRGGAALLATRIEALRQRYELRDTVRRQQEQLATHQKRLQRERHLAGRLFTRIVDAGTLELPNIKTMISPMSLFSGDILLSAPKPSGGLHVLLGDFTGHGLAAATGALPVASVFYGMTEKGYSVAEIVSEINAKLRGILPTDMFLAACMIDINPASHTLSIWNGGIPPVLVYGDGRLQQVEARHLPLGVAGDEAFNRRVDVMDVKQGDRIYVVSDGLCRTAAPSGELFGDQQLHQVFEDNRDPQALFDEIGDRLQAFRAGGLQRDDVTLIEIEYRQDILESIVDLEHRVEVSSSRPAGNWSLSLELGAPLLRHFDPLPMLIQSVCDMLGLHGQRQQLYTIFSELFSNALDHGLLKLDSQLKKTADGFAKYYLQRDSRLSALDDGKISIRVSHLAREQGGELTVSVEDSGDGFDFQSNQPGLENNLGHAGRGIPLLRSLCDEVSYHGNGNTVTVVFRWQ